MVVLHVLPMSKFLLQSWNLVLFFSKYSKKKNPFTSRVRKYRKAAEDGTGLPVLYLNAGDTYTGTPWFSLFKENITSDFMNVLQPDAIVSFSKLI